MSFKSYRSSRSKFRRTNRNDVSAQAEPCELRALLSASAITVGIAEAAPCDAVEAEAVASTDDVEKKLMFKSYALVNIDAESPVDGKLMDFVGDESWNSLLACDGFMALEGDVVEGDGAEGDASDGDVVPIRYLMRSFGTIEETGIADDSVPMETFSVGEDQIYDESFVVQDFVADENSPSEEWDPTWAYQSFVPTDGVVTDGEPTDKVEEEIDDTELDVDDSEVKVNIYHSLNPGTTDDGVFLEEPVAIEDAPPVDGWDQSWLYRSFAGSPEGVIDDAVKTDDIEMEDGVTVDEMVVDESVTPEDAPPVDGWDQSWLYRTLETPDAKSLDSDGDGLPDDFVMYPYDPIPMDQLGEDGLGCGVSPDGFVPGDVPSNDADGDGLPDEFVMDAVDSDGSFDPRILMSFGGGVDGPEGSGIDDAEGETKEVTDSTELGIEEELYLYPVDEVIELGEVELLVSDSDDSSELQIRYLSAAGGPEVQRTLSSSSGPALESSAGASLIEATTNDTTTSVVAPTPQTSIPTNFVPVRETSSNSLFSAARDKSNVGVALTSPSGGGTVGSPLGTKSSSTAKRAKSQLQSNSNNSDETSGLENLSPLIGDEADSPEVNSAPSPQDLQVDEQITAEPAVSRNENVDSNSRVVAQSSQSAYINRPGMIDEVMSQYAENSFSA